MTLILNTDQTAGLVKAQDWFNDPTLPFVLMGYAGTGKTTLIEHVIDGLGLTGGDVAYGAYTGKAASVMRHKGNATATTIHRMIYKTFVRTVMVPKVDTKGKPLLGADGKPMLRQKQFFEVAINDESILNTAALCVLDECSMVKHEMLDDLRSFNVPIIMIGDPGQLPPPGGESPFDALPCSHRLDQIVRQAYGNPIIALASHVRNGGHMNHFSLANQDRILRANLADLDDLLDLPDTQIVTGTRKMRATINDIGRRKFGHQQSYPVLPGAKTICRVNMHKLGIMNGEICTTVSQATDLGPHKILVTITKEGDDPGIFYDVEMSKHRFTIPDDEDVFYKGCGNFEWAYAITGHLSQGSEWGTVVMVDDHMQERKADFRKRWLYTVITRAAEHLILIDAPRGRGGMRVEGGQVGAMA